MDTNPLNEVNSWKEVVQPTKKPRNLDPRKSKLIQKIKKTTNNKKAQQRNKKSKVLLYRYIRIIKARTRNQGVIIHQVT